MTESRIIKTPLDLRKEFNLETGKDWKTSEEYLFWVEQKLLEYLKEWECPWCGYVFNNPNDEKRH